MESVMNPFSLQLYMIGSAVFCWTHEEITRQAAQAVLQADD